MAGQLVAAVERKALADLTSGVLNGNLKYQLTELAALPRAAVVVEDRYSEIFAHSFARPTAIADGLAELQIGFPNVPIVFCQTRKLAQEYTYRYLAAALTWFVDDADATTVFEPAAAEPEPSSAELRAWAKASACRCPTGGACARRSCRPGEPPIPGDYNTSTRPADAESASAASNVTNRPP